MKEEVEMEYTDLSCDSPAIAEAIKAYHDEQIAQCEDPPNITAIVEEDTLRITFEGVSRTDRHGWDMQLLGYRDGYDPRHTAAVKQLVEAAGWALRTLETLAKAEAERSNSTAEMCDYSGAKALRAAISAYESVTKPTGEGE